MITEVRWPTNKQLDLPIIFRYDLFSYEYLFRKKKPQLFYLFKFDQFPMFLFRAILLREIIIQSKNGHDHALAINPFRYLLSAHAQTFARQLLFSSLAIILSIVRWYELVASFSAQIGINRKGIKKELYFFRYWCISPSNSLKTKV